MMEWDPYEFTPLWEWVGATLETTADEQSLAATGVCDTPMAGDRDIDYFDYWYGYVPVGVTLTGGVYEMDLYGGSVASLDLITDIFVMPGSWCTATFDGDEEFGTRDDAGPWPLAFYFWGPSLISSSRRVRQGVQPRDRDVRDRDACAHGGGRRRRHDGSARDGLRRDERRRSKAQSVQIYQTTSSSGIAPEQRLQGRPVYSSGQGDSTSVPSDASGMSNFTVTTVAWDAATVSYAGGLTAIVNPDMFIRARVPGRRAACDQPDSAGRRADERCRVHRA